MKNPDIVVFETVAAPLQAVWESWADFGGIDKFHKDVLRTTILTSSIRCGVGAVRRCELADGKNDIEERIVEWRPREKLGVEFKRTSLPISHARADFLFETDTNEQTRLEMRMSFTPRGLLLHLLKPMMRRRMQSGFQALLRSNKAFVEGSLG